MCAWNMYASTQQHQQQQQQPGGDSTARLEAARPKLPSPAVAFCCTPAGRATTCWSEPTWCCRWVATQHSRPTPSFVCPMPAALYHTQETERQHATGLADRSIRCCERRLPVPAPARPPACLPALMCPASPPPPNLPLPLRLVPVPRTRTQASTHHTSLCTCGFPPLYEALAWVEGDDQPTMVPHVHPPKLPLRTCLAVLAGHRRPGGGDQRNAGLRAWAPPVEVHLQAAAGAAGQVGDRGNRCRMGGVGWWVGGWGGGGVGGRRGGRPA